MLMLNLLLALGGLNGQGGPLRLGPGIGEGARGAGGGGGKPRDPSPPTYICFSPHPHTWVCTNSLPSPLFSFPQSHSLLSLSLSPHSFLPVILDLCYPFLSPSLSLPPFPSLPLRSTPCPHQPAPPSTDLPLACMCMSAPCHVHTIFYTLFLLSLFCLDEF